MITNFLLTKEMLMIKSCSRLRAEFYLKQERKFLKEIRTNYFFRFTSEGIVFQGIMQRSISITERCEVAIEYSSVRYQNLRVVPRISRIMYLGVITARWFYPFSRSVLDFLFQINIGVDTATY